MQDKKNFHHESLEDKDSIKKYLNAISEALESGKLQFSDDEDTIEMLTSELMYLKVSASQEDGRNRFTLRVTWQDDPQDNKQKGTLKVNKK